MTAVPHDSRRTGLLAALLIASSGSVACGDSEFPAVRGEPTAAGTVSVQPLSGAPLDRVARLPANPQGLAVMGDVLLVGNREDPWGFLRLTPQGGGVLRAEKVAMVEEEFDQRMGFTSVAWNGRAWVALTDGSWLGRSGTNLFTTLDAEDLHLLDAAPAPPMLGCLAWDGSAYWAATRKNTEDEAIPALLYRLSPEFEVLAEVPAPGLGCQGMTWDGAYLWLADVFSDLLYVVDVREADPRVVRTVDPGLTYLSGVAFYGGGIWVVEYGENRLARVAGTVTRGR